MINSVDRKAVIKTLVIYTAVIFLLIYGFKVFNRVSFIAVHPEIKAALALLLVVAISYMKIPTEFTFLICGILGSFIMGISLLKYVGFLYNEASSISTFMIAVSGAVVAAIARGDLLDGISKLDKTKEREKYLNFHYQISVFCLFHKLQSFIKRIKKRSEFFAALIFLFQNMLLFVSSVVSASTFSSMLKTKKNRSSEENVYINAGILCMCVSGCLLTFFFMKSPWWLFFLGFEKDLNVHVQIPLATLIYGFFSFVHGYYLLLKADKFSVGEYEVEQHEHPLAQRHFIIYVGLIIIFLLFTLSVPVAIIGKRDATAAEINQGVVTILVLILTGIIAATVITRNIMQRSLVIPEKSNIINELRLLILGDSKSDSGIKSVIGLLILIITILGFRDMISICVNSSIQGVTKAEQAPVINLVGVEGILALLWCLIILAVVMIIGWILGSNFGAFSIGLIIFSIISSKILVLNHNLLKRWIMEGIIIVSTFSNQVSPASSNAATLISGSDESSRKIQIDAWKVKSFFDISAFKVQVTAMLICIVLSGILTLLGIQ